MDNEEFQNGMKEITTLNNILLQVLLFKQKSLVEDIIPTREGVILFVNGIVSEYPEEERLDILTYIDSIEAYSDKELEAALEDIKNRKKDTNKKQKIIKFC